MVVFTLKMAVKFSVCFVHGGHNNENGTYHVPILCFILFIVIAQLFINYVLDY
jgi:hypothetical protein